MIAFDPVPDEQGGDACADCGKPIAEDASPGVWVHDADELGDEAYDLNEDHAARPDVEEA